MRHPRIGAETRFGARLSGGLLLSLSIGVLATAGCEPVGDEPAPADEPPSAEPPSTTPPPPSETDVTTKTSALTSAVGRLYFKQNGQIAVGVDANGAMFTPSQEQGGVGGTPFNAFPGLVFKQNGTALYGFEQSSSTDVDQLGRILIRNDFLAELVSSMPLPGETGVLLLKNSGTALAEFDHLDHNGSLLIHSQIVRYFKYRKSAITLNPIERQTFVDAMLFINGQHYSGTACGAVATGIDKNGNNYTYRLPGNVSFYAKSDEAHANTQSHNNRNLLPWHRMLLNHIEGQLRAYDPTVSIPYWDWESTPHGLLMDPVLPGFMGHPNNTVCGKNANGIATNDGVTCVADGNGNAYGWQELGDSNPSRTIGSPWQGTGVTNPLYDPTCSTACSDMGLDPCTHPTVCPNPCRENLVTSSWNTGFIPKGVNLWSSINLFGGEMLSVADMVALPSYDQLANEINIYHQDLHSWLGMGGGDLGPFETSARVPILYLMHAAIDRVWALWQAQGAGRTDVNQPMVAYGSYYNTPLAGELTEGINSSLEPWADTPPASPPWRQYRHSRPFLASTSECLAPPAPSTPDTCTSTDTAQRDIKTSLNATVLTPPLYQ